MKLSKLPLAAVVSLCGVSLVACNPAADGSAEPLPGKQQATSNSQESPSKDLPKNGAPAVKEPLDVSSIKDDPCEAMTEKQAGEFPGTLLNTETRSGKCAWKYEGDRYRLGSVGGGLELDSSKGLTKYYGDIDDDVAVVDPVDAVEGYPTVHFDADVSTGGVCALEVGLRDDLVYTAQAILESDHPSYDNPCDAARDFAEVVVGNLKEAQ